MLAKILNWCKDSSREFLTTENNIFMCKSKFFDYLKKLIFFYVIY